MKADDEAAAGVFTGAAILLVAGIFSAWLFLTWLSKPAEYASRVAEVTHRLDRAEALASVAAIDGTHSPHAVCPSPSGDSLGAVKTTFLAAASGSGLASPVITLSPLDAGENAPLAPVRVSMQATGSNEAIMGLLGQLERGAPELFVDRLDLRSKSSAVDFVLTGKVYCWLGAQ